MNLQRMTYTGVEPAALQAALQRHFTTVTRQNNCRVWPYQIAAYDDTGRIRIRISYMWSENQFRWFYAILPGDRP